MTKERDKGIDFIRALSALTIVVYHFGCHSAANLEGLVHYKNGTWGELAVSLFFMISGAVMYMNNREVGSCKDFYYKRARSIYPMYWIVSALVVIAKVHFEGKFFYGPGPQLLTVPMAVLGLGGYFHYLIPCYELCGDWFLGAIVLLYLMYPVISIFVQRQLKIFFILIAALFLWVSFFNRFEIEPHRNLITCLFSFTMGIYIFRNKKILENNVLLIVAAIIALLQFVIQIDFNANVVSHFFAIATFMVLYRIGKLLAKIKALDKLILLVAGISYPIFLLQHAVIIQVTRRYNPVDLVSAMGLMVGIMAVTIVGACIVKKLSRVLLNGLDK